MLRKLLIPGLFAALFLPLYGQAPDRSDRLTTDRGLSNNFVVSLDFDRFGALWIGTEEGMNRFDGYSVRRYTRESGTIPGNGLNQVLADNRSDTIWAGTQRDGLGTFDYNTGESAVFLPDGRPGGIAAKEITHLEQDGDGNIWISTYQAGIDRYSPATGEFTHYDSASVEGMLDQRIHCFTLGVDGKVYIGHYGEGVTILDPAKRTAVRFDRRAGGTNLPSNIIGCVYRDPDGNIWFGTMRGLALYRPVSQDFLVFDRENAGLPDGEIFSMMVTRDRRLLVSPDYSGVWTADLDSLSTRPAFVPLPQAEQMSNIGIHAMCEDRFGNLWLGSYGRGVLFVGKEGRPFASYRYPDPLSDYSVTAVTFTPDGDLLVGTEGGQVDILDRAMRRKEDPRAVNTGHNILSAAVDADGRLWVGGFSGYTRVYSPQGRLLFEVPVGEARCFLEQGDRMWMGSGSGLHLLDRKSGAVLAHWSSDDILPENWLRSLALDPQGRLWVGTFGGGIIVFRLPQMEPVARFKSDGVSAGDMVNALLPDGADRMWAGTGNGLVRFDLSGPKPLVDTTFSLRAPLRSSFVRSLCYDASGNLWFATNLSLGRVDRQDGSIFEYDYRSLLSSGNFQNGAVSVRDDGLLCFGSTEGITTFYPDALARKGAEVGIHFSELDIFASASPEDAEQVIFLGGRGEIELTHRQNNFLVAFAPDDPDLAGQTEFSYRLGGGSADTWYPAENDNYLNFRQLPPGKYLLQVRARVVNGAWGPEESLQVRINPPWWRTRGAILLYLLLALTLVVLGFLAYAAWLRRSNELEQEKSAARMMQESNEERLRFYTNITHELRTPLTLILSPAEDLKADPSLSERARTLVDVLLQNANRLLDLVNTLLNFRKTETNNIQLHASWGNLSAMVEGIGRVFVDANTHHETEIRLEIEPGVLAEFDPDVVTSILNNLLSNALKYTPDGSVTLSLHRMPEAGRIEIGVADTGYGIPADQFEKIFERYYQIQDGHMAMGTGIGLSLVKNLVQLAGWEIRVESEPGRGSLFCVSLPLVADPLPEQMEAADLTGEQQEQKPIVVIVEDNESIRNYVRETLADLYSVVPAKDGRDGLSVIYSTVPDLVISDIMMPEMDGIELCRRLRQDIRVSHIPVILLTAKDSMDARSEGYEAGADSYLTKPFTGNMLRSRIRNLLESRRRLAEQYRTALQERKDPAAAGSPLPAIENEFVRKLNELVEDNLSSEGLDVTWLAEQFNMSASTLYRKMKALTGISTNEYIRRIRMRKAGEMLASGNFNVSETAWNIGISSLIYFRQCFKEEYGCSPSEFRRRVRDGSEPHS